MLHPNERHTLLAAARRFDAERLATGTGGNLSIVVGDDLVITPSAVPFGDLTPDMIPVISREDGRLVDGALRPSSEWEMHLRAVETTGAGAVVHTHSAAATAVACMDQVTELPAFHYYVQILGGPVRVTEYARYGTPLIAERAARALAGRTACLLGNHGALTCGDTIDEAFDKAVELEWLCDMFLRITAAGRPRLLGEADLAEFQEGLADYLQPTLVAEP